MTRSIITRLKALNEEYRDQITRYFDIKRRIVSKQFDTHIENAISLVTARAENLAKALHPNAICNVYDYTRQGYVKVEIFYSFKLNDLGIADIEKDRQKAVDELCPLQKQQHRLLHEWNQKCLLTGEIVPFDCPQLTEEESIESDTIGCA